VLQRSWYWLLLAGVAMLVGIGLFAVTVPSGDYLYVPNEARPLASKVEVEDETTPDATGGVYYVDVTLRRARWLDRIVPFVRPEGSTLVPGHAVTSPGQSFKERIAAAQSEMSRSEQIAAAVGACRIEPVLVPHDCTDGFFAGYWRRPEAYLDAGARAAISGLALLPDDVIDRMVTSLREDLASGVWKERHADLLALDAYDCGYRLVVA